MRASNENAKMVAQQKRNPHSAQMMESLMSSGYGAAPPSVPTMNEPPRRNMLSMRSSMKRVQYDTTHHGSDTSTRGSSTHYSWDNTSSSGRTHNTYSHSNWNATDKSRHTVDRSLHVSTASRQSTTPSQYHTQRNRKSAPATSEAPSHKNSSISSKNNKDKTNNTPYIPSEKDCDILRNALVSLYRDRLRPCRIDLSRRLKQFGATEELLVRYKEAYENITDYEVDVDDNGKPIILLAFPPEDFTGFVDLTDPNDPYPEEMWQAFAEYVTGLLSVSQASSNSESLRSLTGSLSSQNLYTGGTSVGSDTIHEVLSESSNRNSDTHSITSDKSKHKLAFTRPYQYRGGRYGMAEEMYNRNLSFLRGRALGEVCHIVELAIKKGLLAYENELLQPVSACMRITTASLSAQGVKLQEYMSNQDLGFPHLRENGSPVETLQEAREVVAEFIQPWPQGIHISKLKYNILENRNVYISPTMFGHTRLSTLLSSDSFADICRVIHKSNNHILVQSVHYKKPDNVPLFVSSKGKDAKLKVLSPESLWRAPDMTEIPYKWATMMLDCAKQAVEEEMCALDFSTKRVECDNNINASSIEEEEEDADIPAEFDDEEICREDENASGARQRDRLPHIGSAVGSNEKLGVLFEKTLDLLVQAFSKPIGSKRAGGAGWAATPISEENNPSSSTHSHNNNDDVVQNLDNNIGINIDYNNTGKTGNLKWKVFSSYEIGELPLTDDESSRRSSPAQLPIIQLFGTAADYQK